MRRTAAPGIIIVFLVLTGLFHEVNGKRFFTFRDVCLIGISQNT